MGRVHRSVLPGSAEWGEEGG
eukprot:COSAG01_NODE_57450_length_312_cov_0.732394_1_plen_20_part_10